MPPPPMIMQLQVDNTPLRQHNLVKGHFQTSGGQFPSEIKGFSEISKEPLRDINPLHLYNKSDKQHLKVL